jgi:hypothetical protein
MYQMQEILPFQQLPIQREKYDAESSKMCSVPEIFVFEMDEG